MENGQANTILLPKPNQLIKIAKNSRCAGPFVAYYADTQLTQAHLWPENNKAISSQKFVERRGDSKTSEKKQDNTKDPTKRCTIQ